MGEKKKRKAKSKQYFGPIEEEAVVRFLNSDDQIERDRIYNKYLRHPFDKMIESIIRKYKLYRRDVVFENLHSDTLSFLIIKSDKFKPSKGKKAYSYYGTICKNYLLSLLINDEKELKRLYSYEDFSTTVENDDDFSYKIDEGNFNFEKFIQTIIDSIEVELDSDDIPGRKKLTENEIKVGYALIEILGNWEVTLDEMNGGNKYNKNTVLATMRNYTNLTTKDIRLGMKRYKNIYVILKLDGIEHGVYDDENNSE